jgi:hypothetical protein
MTMDNSLLEGQTPTVSPGNYSPVTINIKDTVGAALLGTLAVILLIGWMRSESRYRDLIGKQTMHPGNSPQDTQ